MAATAARLDGAATAALRGYLLAVADDELILGHRHSEWTGFGPDVESDVALSSIAQEEMGHARLFYEQALGLGDRGSADLDALVFDRPPEAFRHAVLLERPNGDWGFTIVRLVLYEHADAVRLEAMTRSALESLAALARTLQREEKYHRLYGETWLKRLAAATEESRARIQAAVVAAWAEARGLFEPVADEDHLRNAGVLAESADRQEGVWRERVGDLCASLGLRIPEVAAAGGGRRGAHSADLAALLDDLTAVRRLEPEAAW